VHEKSRDNERPPRNLVEEDCYRERLHELKLQHAILDEIFEELAPALGRFPEIYPGVDGIHRVMIAGGSKHPPLRIWFSFDEQNVYLLDIERTDRSR
jgi:hypothetical protein